MTQDGRPSTLHSGGFGHVPIALQRDPRASSEHIDVYAAISGAVGYRSGAGEVRRRRIIERSKRKRQIVTRAVADLESWGYLEASSRPGRPILYRLLPTGPVDLGQERRADALASDPHRTGRIGGRSKGRSPEGPALKGTGSVRKGGSRWGPTPQSERDRVNSGAAGSGSTDGGIVPHRALWEAIARALGYDLAQIPATVKTRLTRATNEIGGAGGVPAEVPYRVARFKERFQRMPGTPLDLRDQWPRLDCEKARRARALRSEIVADGWDGAGDIDETVVRTIDANPDGDSHAAREHREGGQT